VIRRWTLPICTGCGGVIGLRGLDSGCSCDVDFAKTGKSVEVIPVDAPNVLSEEEARLVQRVWREDLTSAEETRIASILDRLRAFSEGTQGG
jgi:hypothetical protein